MITVRTTYRPKLRGSKRHRLATLQLVQRVQHILTAQLRHEWGIGFDAAEEPATWRIAEAIVAGLRADPTSRCGEPLEGGGYGTNQ